MRTISLDKLVNSFTTASSLPTVFWMMPLVLSSATSLADLIMLPMKKTNAVTSLPAPTCNRSNAIMFRNMYSVELSATTGGICSTPCQNFMSSRMSELLFWNRMPTSRSSTADRMMFLSGTYPTSHRDSWNWP
ncbi:unnamed protein product [Urochloa decumbens]|uniref:Secreted protein n=1 Tax=Urochloa decumbens TaxID=240449 RepID=A0ABC9AZD8_9POAL